MLVSRVRELAGLCLLQVDRKGLGAVAELQHDEFLHAAEAGYDKLTGCWRDELAAQALGALRASRLAAKQAKAAAKKAAATARASTK